MNNLMKGKRGLIMGVANDHSIAWGIAKALAAQGAELAFTYQGEALGKRVKPLAQSLGVELILPCDVENPASIDQVFETLRGQWGRLDFLVHAIAFSDKNELKGRYADTSRENFSRTMLISCFSFTELARRAAELMPASGGAMVTLTYGGSSRVMPNYNVMGVAKAALEASVRYLAGAMVTLTYGGSSRVMPNYNVMGVAKAALEASVRYLAADFGPRRIRINALSAGPVRTLAGAVIGDSRQMLGFQKRNAPLRRMVSIDEIGGSALYLLSDLSSGVTGEIHFVDSGYNIVSMPRLEALKLIEEAESKLEQGTAEAAK